MGYNLCTEINEAGGRIQRVDHRADDCIFDSRPSKTLALVTFRQQVLSQESPATAYWDEFHGSRLTVAGCLE